MSDPDFSVQPLIDAWARATVEARAACEARANGAANAVAAVVRAAYAIRTGDLQRGVRVVEASRDDGVMRARVQSTAPHVYIYEHGTAERFDSTRRGARRGRSPAQGPMLVPAAQRERAAMYAEFAIILEGAFRAAD